MGIYKILYESEQSEILKRPFEGPIKRLKEAIEVYNVTEDEEELSDLLGMILQQLEEINSLMNRAGITYTPAIPEDEPEEVFRQILDKHVDTCNNFMKSGTTKDFESFNVQNRYVTSLVDVHRTQYVKERRSTFGPRNLTLE